mmetsp:Transcript_45054/g.111656  ORF Transcript_45054/g.111656 Transcript_45054/m.111656 type:complete len:219 (-) Transcript_45054:47-703(-)
MRGNWSRFKLRYCVAISPRSTKSGCSRTSSSTTSSALALEPKANCAPEPGSDSLALRLASSGCRSTAKSALTVLRKSSLLTTQRCETSAVRLPRTATVSPAPFRSRHSATKLWICGTSSRAATAAHSSGDATIGTTSCRCRLLKRAMGSGRLSSGANSGALSSSDAIRTPDRTSGAWEPSAEAPRARTPDRKSGAHAEPSAEAPRATAHATKTSASIV